MSNMKDTVDDVHRCESCDIPMHVRGYKHVEQVGNVKVTDGTGLAPQCQKCGKVSLLLSDLAGYERRAAALVLRDGKHVDGSVIKYARKALGLRQTELAFLLQCTPETISRWENGANPMKRAEQLAIVALLDGVQQGVIEAWRRGRRGTDVTIDSPVGPELRPHREERPDEGLHQRDHGPPAARPYD